MPYRRSPHTWPRALPPDSLLGPLNPVRTYTIRNGKFGPAGSIVWEPGTDSQGRPVNDTNYDVKEVRTHVQWTQPTAGG